MLIVQYFIEIAWVDYPVWDTFYHTLNSTELLSEPKWAALGLVEKPVIIKSVQINIQHIETKDFFFS